MTVEDFTFPQNGDADFAENFGTWLGRSNVTDYVEEGMDVSISDSTAPEVTVTEGKAFVSEDSATISSNSETRLTLDYVIIRPQTTVTSNEGLTDGDVNYVYLRPNLDTNDSPEYVSFTATADADPNDLLIAEVDLVNNDVSARNRDVDMVAGELLVGVNLGIPVYSELSNAQSGQGNLVYIDGNGSDSAGMYIHDGSNYKKVGIDQLDDLSDVNGVTALQEDSSGNRPSAGTEGRIFFNTSDNTVEYDTGSQWNVLGADPAGIQPGDLGFDPATQTELDNHASSGSVHHSKTNTLDELTDSDIDGIVTETQTNRPQAGDSGRLFFATDTNRLYYDNGSNWRLIGAGSHDDLNGISSNDHHSRYADSEARSAVTGTVDISDLRGDKGSTDEIVVVNSSGGLYYTDISNAGSDYTDTDAQDAINNDSDHGSTAPHNYFSGNHYDLNSSSINSDDHHSRPSAGTGINGGSTWSVDESELNHNDMSLGSSDHHSRPSAGNYLNGGGSFDVDIGSIPHDNLLGGSDNDAHHERPSAGFGLDGGSTWSVDESDLDHDNLSGAFRDDAHHSKYQDADAINAVNGRIDNAATDIAGLDDAVANNNNYTDSDAVSAINNDKDHGSTAPHNYYDDFDALTAVTDDLGRNLDRVNGQFVTTLTSYFEQINIDGYQTSTDWRFVDTGSGLRLGDTNDSRKTYFVIQDDGDADFKYNCVIQGDFSVKGNKSFVIEHPSSQSKELRHSAYEGPVTGGLVYRDTVTVDDGTAKPDFPEYVVNGDFGEDWTTSLTPKGHFGRAYLDTDDWIVHADEDGEYDVVIFGMRNDEDALNRGGSVVEKQKSESWEDAEKRANDGEAVGRVENATGGSTVYEDR